MLTVSRPKTGDSDGLELSAEAGAEHGPPPPVIEFSGVAKRFRLQSERTLTQFLPRLVSRDAWRPPFWALQDVSFAINRGETVGLIGRNGSGKSTTLKLIAGVMLPTQGEVRVTGRISPLIQLGAGFHPDLSGRENIYLNASMLGLTNVEIRRAIPDIVAFSGLEHFMDTPIKRFSSGMYIRLAFSVAVHTRPEILLVDEALSVGDAPFKEKCMARMAQLQEEGVTILFVSHGLDAVRDFCPRVLVMDSGHVVFDGDGGEAIDLYNRLAASVPSEATAASPEGYPHVRLRPF